MSLQFKQFTVLVATYFTSRDDGDSQCGCVLIFCVCFVSMFVAIATLWENGYSSGHDIFRTAGQ